jgi:hypothetical protein
VSSTLQISRWSSFSSSYLQLDRSFDSWSLLTLTDGSYSCPLVQVAVTLTLNFERAVTCPLQLSCGKRTNIQCQNPLSWGSQYTHTRRHTGASLREMQKTRLTHTERSQGRSPSQLAAASNHPSLAASMVCCTSLRRTAHGSSPPSISGYGICTSPPPERSQEKKHLSQRSGSVMFRLTVGALLTGGREGASSLVCICRVDRLVGIGHLSDRR